jgi:uncharacterized damage-inducible protein DinB
MDFQKEIIEEFERETTNTRKIFAAIPDGVDFGYKPHPKSMGLGGLVAHIDGIVGQWGLSVLTTDKLEAPQGHKPDAFVPASTSDLLEHFDKAIAATKAELGKFSVEKWDQNWQYISGGKVIINQTKGWVFRICIISHMIHHRAQLGVYLRLLDQPIPGMYGPSADEH